MFILRIKVLLSNHFLVIYILNQYIRVVVKVYYSKYRTVYRVYR